MAGPEPASAARSRSRPTAASTAWPAYGSANDATGAPNTVDTVFSIGSVTKAFTAATVLDLVAEGRLSLDDRVGRLLPELTGPVADATVRQLLLHTSGLTGSHGEDHQPLDRDAALAAIAGLELAFTPGSDYVYSNAGYTLLATGHRGGVGHALPRVHRVDDPAPAGRAGRGRVLGRRAGRAGPARRRVPRRRPDRASRVTSPDRTGRSTATASLAMTMRDLAAWTHALFTGRLVSRGVGRGHRHAGVRPGRGPVRDSGLGGVRRVRLRHAVPRVRGRRWRRRPRRRRRVGPAERRGLVAMASNKPGVTAEELLRKLGPALIAGEPLPTPDETPAAAGPSSGGGAAAGTYELDHGRHVRRHHRGQPGHRLGDRGGRRRGALPAARRSPGRTTSARTSSASWRCSPGGPPRRAARSARRSRTRSGPVRDVAPRGHHRPRRRAAHLRQPDRRDTVGHRLVRRRTRTAASRRPRSRPTRRR